MNAVYTKNLTGNTKKLAHGLNTKTAKGANLRKGIKPQQAQKDTKGISLRKFINATGVTLLCPSVPIVVFES